MNRNKKLGILLLIVAILIIVGALYSVFHLTSIEQTKPEDIIAIKSTVTSFGENLKMVSLLAPSDSIKANMETSYAPYVAPELLAQWESDPTQAPGKTVSSPWPDRIDIGAVTENSDGSYTVTGNVIEVTSEEEVSGGVASMYPVTMVLEKRNGSDWLIQKFEKGAYESVVSMTGQYVCLAHRNTSGPQTLECALGIQADSGLYYAVDTSDVPGSPILNVKTGDRIKIEGDLVPIEAISTDQWQKYNIAGIIKVTSLSKVSS